MRLFRELGLIHDIGDVFAIDWDQVRGLEGFGEVSIANLQRAIEAAKERRSQTCWSASTSATSVRPVHHALAQALGHLGAIMTAPVDDMARADGVGTVIAQAVHEWFADEGHAPSSRSCGPPA